MYQCLPGVGRTVITNKIESFTELGDPMLRKQALIPPTTYLSFPSILVWGGVGRKLRSNFDENTIRPVKRRSGSPLVKNSYYSPNKKHANLLH